MPLSSVIAWCIASFVAGGLTQLFIGDVQLRRLSRRIDEIERRAQVR